MKGTARRLISFFGETTRQRGYAYFRERRVTFTGNSGQEFAEAIVQGTRRYWASARLSGSRLTVHCDCPAFLKQGPCKHLWALILASDEQGAFPTIESAEHFELEIEYGDDSDVEMLPPASPPPPRWRQQMESLRLEAPRNAWPAGGRVIYGVNLRASRDSGRIVLGVALQRPKRDGSWLMDQPGLRRSQIASAPTQETELLASLAGASPYQHKYAAFVGDAYPSWLELSGPLAASAMPRVLATGRCWLLDDWAWDFTRPLAWDAAGPWRWRLALCPTPELGCEALARLQRGSEVIDAALADLISPSGYIVYAGLVAPLEFSPAHAWLRHLSQGERLAAEAEERDAFAAALIESELRPLLDLPDDLQVREERMLPQPAVAFRRQPGWVATDRFGASLDFIYDSWRVEALSAKTGHLTPDRRFLLRDRDAENRAKTVFYEVGVRTAPKHAQTSGQWEVPSKRLPQVLRHLSEAGWRVEIEGQPCRPPGDFVLRVSSGVDWFDLSGAVEYGEVRAPLPALLVAMRQGDGMITLSDGSQGLLSEDILRRFAGLAGLGTAHGDSVRFRSCQAAVLDVLLAGETRVLTDSAFNALRAELRGFDGIAAAPQPPGFVGQLRDYQCDGLAWMLFLRRCGLGGCLADDMGVGKTAQALALLELLRTTVSKKDRRPSLVVAPRSLMFNWREEAARFTPKLRVLDLTSSEGGGDWRSVSDCDVALITYGLLRQRILRMKDIEFDLVILDEAQAIKNASTATAKAARLLQARQRLALSGTPVENRIADLWSLFEFLNPGLLGTAAAFDRWSRPTGPNALGGDEARAALARVLRPFILRRTKEQVARELPAKTEQTLMVEMKPPQRKLYDELRQHYRQLLLPQVDRVGLAKSKIMVLEALLRLRQAACHPALVSPKHARAGSAKIDALFEQLAELRQEGHKALVFSQFTSMLAIVRKRLDADNADYEYLDGRTRDRQARVERFQADSNCGVFLISLKAGGVGLNLTAAEYVFVLDPWWNPAVEAQAVDRAHRIGQTRNVFAYRMIVRDSIEEKVLALQESKRDLAASLIGGGNSLLRDLKREDLEILLG